MMTIKQDIQSARTIEVLLDNSYTDLLRSLRVTVTKEMANAIVDAAPEGGKPKAKWEGTNLVLLPNVSKEY